jgi:hypothetical protein
MLPKPDAHTFGNNTRERTESCGAPADAVATTANKQAMENFMVLNENDNDDDVS